MNQNSNYVCIDFETRSVCDLPKAGSHKYSQHETTRIQCLAWAIGDDPVSIWFPCDPTPHRLLEHVETGGVVCGWNAGQFEVPLWNNCLLRDHPEWPPLRIEQIDDTMARAYASSLPGSLERCAIAVNLDARKDKSGYSLMIKLCKPTAKWRKNPVGEPEWHDDQEDLIKLGEYCKQDVVVERELRRIIAPLSKRERAVWLADQKINERGIHVDVKAVEDALRLVTAEKADLTKKLHEVSKGKISTGGSVPQVIEFLASEGVELPNLKKRTVSRRLRSEEPMSDVARQVLTIRADLSKSSTSKLSAMLASRDHDGGCRGLFSYHVATTGRWAGRRIQPHNFMRPDEEVFFNQDQIENCIALFGEDHGAEVITMAYAPLLSAVASCMRGLIVSKDGHEFVGGDFIGVENRVLMWLAGEEWMIEEFRKFDRGEGVDNYKLTYSKAFNVPIESVTKPQRLIGKVGALACGFAGSVGAYLNMGDNYDVVPADVAKAARETVSEFIWNETLKRYPKEEKWRFGLKPETWTGIKIVVDAWRNAHPNVTQFWWDCQDCAIAAVHSRGHVIVNATGRLKFACDRDGHFLLIRLPSGRYLHYPQPFLAEEMFAGKPKTVLKYHGLDKIRKRDWVARTLTPQILSENATSGTARDVLSDAMLRAEARDYPIALHVHDELVAQMPTGTGDPDTFRDIMCDSAPWLDGLPVAADCWIGNRYRK